MLKITEVRLVPPHPSDEAKARTKKLTIHVWPKNETIIDNLVNRRSRPHDEWKKLLPEAIKQVAAELSLTEEYAVEAVKKARWSQYAGCKSCPCSPGFVVSGIRSKAFVSVDIIEEAA